MLPGNVYAVLLAGGSGTRFWPKSRRARPKQLCAITDPSRTMLEETLARVVALVPARRVIVVTLGDLLAATEAVLKDWQVRLCVGEPEAKNTAAALAVACSAVERCAAQDGVSDPVMCSFHADHKIDDDAAFASAVLEAVKSAGLNYLTLLAVRPSSPATGYGYLQQGALLHGAATDAWHVKRFCEKPDRATAESFLERGDHFWNSGIFTWRTQLLRSELAVHLPQLVALSDPAALAWDGHAATLQVSPDLYANLQGVSIDNGLLEKSQHVAAVSVNFKWCDVGSWDAVDDCRPASDSRGNRIVGHTVLNDCTGSVIESDGPLIAAIGLQDMVVVVDSGIVLVCPKDRAQQVRDLVEQLVQRGQEQWV